MLPGSHAIERYLIEEQLRRIICTHATDRKDWYEIDRKSWYI